ncbi:MAG: alpha/beta fold hydrolase [Micromonosporaceae bacterium]
MIRFPSYDGTQLAYHQRGAGTPLICVPGGPGCASAYLGDLGGLSARRQLIQLDPRGTGDSAVPEDPATYQCVRQVDDVEALRLHLELEQIDLLGHSASANIAMLYAARHPDRVRRLVLVTPSWRATELEFDHEQWYAAMRRRADEPWFAEAFAAIQRGETGELTPEDTRLAAPLFYGKWDADAAAHDALTKSVRVPAARDGFGAGDDAYGDPSRLADDLRRLAAPVLVLGGELDPAPTARLVKELAALFPQATAVQQPGAGHSPWIDDPTAFASTVDEFLK